MKLVLIIKRDSNGDYFRIPNHFSPYINNVTNFKATELQVLFMTIMIFKDGIFNISSFLHEGTLVEWERQFLKRLNEL